MRKLLAPIIVGAMLISVAQIASADSLRDAIQRGDYETVMMIVRPLADQGDAASQEFVGGMYEKGQGVPQDYKEAVKWYRLAADQGYLNAQMHLGMMYEKGQGISQDYKEAARWYRLAANQSDADAQFFLGHMYRDGQGVAQDYVRAYMWFNLAAASGDNIAAPLLRKSIADKMTSAQIAQAQEMAIRCKESNYKNCD